MSKASDGRKISGTKEQLWINTRLHLRGKHPLKAAELPSGDGFYIGKISASCIYAVRCTLPFCRMAIPRGDVMSSTIMQAKAYSRDSWCAKPGAAAVGINPFRSWRQVYMKAKASRRLVKICDDSAPAVLSARREIRAGSSPPTLS